MGNDLSRRVALKMGWKEVPAVTGDPNVYPNGKSTTVWEGPLGGIDIEPPGYAHDLNLAWNLVPPYGMINLERYKQGPFAHVSFDGKSGMAFHENPASAICLAWLEAMEGKP